MSEEMTREEVIVRFGVDPEQVGNRPRGWWILDKLDETDEWGGAQVGDLCVKTRDGGSNPIDPDAFIVGQCVGSMQDSFDCTYRYYYYRALSAERQGPMNEDDLITVCDACERASCWQGIFYCDAYKTAGTKEMTRKALLVKGAEHPSYWDRPVPHE